MASFRNVPNGKVRQFEDRLAEAGFDEDLVDLVNGNLELVREWERSLREQLKPPPWTFTHLLQAPEDIFVAFTARAADQDWPFSDEQIEMLYAAMPVSFPSRLDSVLALDVWFGDLPTTFEKLWDWNKYVQGAYWRSSDLTSDPQHLRLLDPTRYGTQPSVRWVVLDLTAYRNQVPADVRKPENSPALAVLAALAVHTELSSAMSSVSITGFWLPGLRATLPAAPPWLHVPILDLNDSPRHGLGLSAGAEARRLTGISAPVFKEIVTDES